MPLIDFAQLNLSIKVKKLQKSHIRIPCTCSTKLEAGYSSEFRRSQICNFCQKFLHRITKCIILKSIFVNNLNLMIPILHNLKLNIITIQLIMQERHKFVKIVFRSEFNHSRHGNWTES